MLIQELHISVLQRLQEVGSYKREKYRSEEIDLALNKAMYRLLEEGVANNFQGDQVNLSHVSALIRKNKVSELIIPSTTDPLYNVYIPLVYCSIPSNFYWLVSGRAEVITNPLNCETAPTLSTTIYTEYVSRVVFDQLGSAPYYTNTRLTTTGAQGSIYIATHPLSAGFNSTLGKYSIIQNMLDQINSDFTDDTMLYYERYRDTYHNNQLKFVTTVNPGIVTLTSNSITNTASVSSTNYRLYNRALIDNLVSKEVTIAPIRVVKDTLGQSSLTNSFYKSRAKEPIVEQTLDYFMIYRDQSFIVTRFYYDYIRKPRTISLSLGQNCELAPTIHHKLVDMAVEILRLDIKDPSYPQTVQDIQNRTI